MLKIKIYIGASPITSTATTPQKHVIRPSDMAKLHVCNFAIAYAASSGDGWLHLNLLYDVFLFKCFDVGIKSIRISPLMYKFSMSFGCSIVITRKREFKSPVNP